VLRQHAQSPSSRERPLLAQGAVVGYRGRMGRSSSKLDLHAAAAFLETVPEGRWTSYGDVAVAGGRSSNAARGVVSWIGSNGHRLSHVYRVLNSNGMISPTWTPAGPGLPANATEVQSRLEAEGVRFEDGRADPAQRWRAGLERRR